MLANYAGLIVMAAAFAGLLLCGFLFWRKSKRSDTDHVASFRGEFSSSAGEDSGGDGGDGD